MAVPAYLPKALRLCVGVFVSCAIGFVVILPTKGKRACGCGFQVAVLDALWAYCCCIDQV
jgi:hypothetical protein